MKIVKLLHVIMLVSVQVPFWTMQAECKPAAFFFKEHSVTLPEGYFILVRKGDAVGAFRVTNLQSQSETEGSAHYESYFKNRRTGSFLDQDVLERTGEIVAKNGHGVHAVVWGIGQRRLWVGNWWFWCDAPNWIIRNLHKEDKDLGF